MTHLHNFLTKFVAFERVSRQILTFQFRHFRGQSIKLYYYFPTVGAFPHKFSIVPTGETTDRVAISSLLSLFS